MAEVFIFKSWKDCLDSAMRPTEYEQKYGISCTGYDLILDDLDIKIAELKKTDNSSTLVILFKKAKNKDMWINFIPTKNQFNTLLNLKEKIEKIESNNELKRMKF